MTSKVLEELDLAQGTLRQNLLAEDIGDLLDGYAFIGLVIHGRTGRGVRGKQEVSFVRMDIGPRVQKMLIMCPTIRCRKLLGRVPW